MFSYVGAYKRTLLTIKLTLNKCHYTTITQKINILYLVNLKLKILGPSNFTEVSFASITLGSAFVKLQRFYNKIFE